MVDLFKPFTAKEYIEDCERRKRLREGARRLCSEVAVAVATLSTNELAKALLMLQSK